MPTGFVSTGRRPPRNFFNAADFEAQRTFFTEQRGLAPTPLHRCAALARDLGVGELLVKDETSRFGLNAFKAVGATFAIATLQRRGDVRAGDTARLRKRGQSRAGRCARGA